MNPRSRKRLPDPMKPIAKIISWFALAATILPSVLFAAGKIELASVKLTMTVATVIWLVTAAIWMEHKTD